MDNAHPSTLSVIVRILATLLAALFVLTALAALVLFNVERRAFNPATYKRVLINENFYQKLPALLGDLLAKNLGSDAPAFAQHMSADNWRTLLEALLPQQELQAMTEESLNQVFAYLNGETQTPRVSLAPLKHSLASPAGLDAALAIIKSQPPCTLGQIAKVLTNFGQELCNPPQEMLDVLRPVIHAQLQATADAIPDEVPLVNSTDSASQPSGLQGLKLLRLLMRLSPLIPFTLLLVITLLVVRTLDDWLSWWGWPLSVTGISGMLVGFSGAPLFRSLIERSISRRAAINMPPEIANAVRGILDAALREMLKPAGWEASVLFLLGLGMVLIAAYLTHREQEKLPPSEAPTQVF
jgi:hypothetical protein